MFFAALFAVAKIGKQPTWCFLSTYCVIQVGTHIIYYSEESYNVVALPVLQIKKPKLRDKKLSRYSV